MLRCRGGHFSPCAKRLHSTAAALWNDTVAKHAEKPAVSWVGNNKEKVFTYSDLESRSNRLARALQQRYGISNGDRVVTVAQNRPELVTLLLACQKIRAAFTPLAPEIARQDLEMLVSRYEPKMVALDDGVSPFGSTSVESHALGELELVGDDSALPLAAEPDDTGMILSTSGTTSLPKGVMWSQRSMSRMYPALHRVGPRQLLYVPLRGVVTPILMLHAFGRGALNVFVDHTPSSPQTWASIIESESITGTLLFGGAMAAMLQAVPDKTFPDVQWIGYGGSPTPVILAQKSMKQFPKAEFYKGWGMTELGFGALLGPDGHVGPDGDPELLAKMESCGPPLGGKAKIENPNEKGEGQLLFCSETVMQGYYKDPEKTKADLKDGWFHTGDLARLDAEGNVYIVDRIKDVIKTEMGQNVAPIDIEKVLLQHPSVGEAGVIGIQHPSMSGEMIVAWLSVKAGKTLNVAEIKSHVDDSGLAPWQMPQSYEITTKPLPKPSGKILKRLLRSPTYVRQNLADQICHVLSKKNTWQEKADEIFNRVDSDHSGTIDEEELKVVAGDSAHSLMEAMDANHDGVVTKAEFRSMLVAFDSDQRDGLLKTMESALASWELEHS